MDDLSRNVNNGDGLFAERRSLNTIPSLVCLNFKVPLRTRQKFKIYAARHNMTMTALLLQLLDDRLTFDANQSQPNSELTKQGHRGNEWVKCGHFSFKSEAASR
jgi:hypothetical protein